MAILVLYAFGSSGAGFWLDLSSKERNSIRSDMIWIRRMAHKNKNLLIDLI